MRVKVDVSSKSENNVKTTTTTTTTFITVRDIIGYAKSGVAIAKALKDALSNLSIKKIFVDLGIAGLIMPLFALAMSLEIVQKIVGVVAMVMPIAQLVGYLFFFKYSYYF